MLCNEEIGILIMQILSRIYTLCTSCKKCKKNQMLNRNPKGHIDIGLFIDYNCGRYFIKNAVFNAGN